MLVIVFSLALIVPFCVLRSTIGFLHVSVRCCGFDRILSPAPSLSPVLPQLSLIGTLLRHATVISADLSSTGLLALLAEVLRDQAQPAQVATLRLLRLNPFLLLTHSFVSEFVSHCSAPASLLPLSPS